MHSRNRGQRTLLPPRRENCVTPVHFPLADPLICLQIYRFGTASTASSRP